MVLKGNYDDVINTINCGEFGVDVVTSNINGEQLVRKVGLAITVKPGFIKGAPTECPLTLEPSTRELGSFAVCCACPHAMLISDDIIEV